MYCSNCGKQTSDAASFCPYCGTKKITGIPQPRWETVRPVQKISNADAEEMQPVYKRKNKMAFLVAFIPLICILCKVMIIGFGIVTAQPHDPYSNLEYIVPDDAPENNEGGAQ